jgi:hypothetical protein
VGVLLVGAFVLAIGYGLACIAAGTALARLIGGPLAFVCLAVLHLAVGALALALAIRRMKRVQLMHDTKLEVSPSVRALSARAHAWGADGSAVEAPSREVRNPSRVPIR